MPIKYNNYHKHDCYGNPWSMDVIVKPEEYGKRAAELGHDTVFTINHGMQGNIFEWMDVAQKYNLKICYGTEAYFVKNRFEKDRSNKHIIIIAKNNDGVMQINDIMTEAHDTGFYYRPRIDVSLLQSLNPKDVIITTACVAGIWDDYELIMALHNKFGDNFLLEVQNHEIDLQKEINCRLLEISRQERIPIIHANDSHYIYPSDIKYRDIFLKGKGREYENSEEKMFLDYPDCDAIYSRYEKQGVLSREQVTEALNNTLIFDECEDITLINTDIKLPSVSDNPNVELKRILNQKWIDESNNIPEKEHEKYLKAIRYEMDIVSKTNMENYFLIDHKVVKDGMEKYNGTLTKTGRGSAPSFYITKMLGLTDIDRIASPIVLFPTRFMSVERILGTHSLPDIDLNTSDREPFIQATKDLLGEENCAWMLAWKPLQDSSAFRVYCRGIGKDISEYDEIAKNLDAYREDKKWKPIIEESKRFIGVIESVSESPCSMLLYDKPVRKELGLVRTSKGKLCCLLDGYNCDKYKYLKNDYLTVTVWAIIKDTCELAGIPIPSIRELDELLDDKTFSIYKDGLTSTINQVDSEFATNLVKRYQPKSVSEMSAFVAIIRPGCASLLQDFIDRKDYTTGVKELDDILVDGSHRMIYQELIMKYLIWLGIPETGSYDIIKKIAKKKFKGKELAELKERLLSGWINKIGKEDGFIETWTVVEQAARYSFNASHSLSYAYDSLYGAYLKSHYPLEYYNVALNYYIGDDVRTLNLTKELSHFGIKLKPIKFRYSNSGYSISREDNSIYKGIQSVKYMNGNSANEMYELRNNKYRNFIELLYDLRYKTSINSRQTKILIGLDFFEEFGDANNLNAQFDMFDSFEGKVQFRKSKLEEFGVPETLIRPYAGRETDRMFTKVNTKEFMIAAVPYLKTLKRSLKDKISAQITHLGYLDIMDDKYTGMAAVLGIDTKYSPKLKMYSLKNGTVIDCKIDKKTFSKCKLQDGDVVQIISSKRKPKVKRLENGNYEEIPNIKELWITKYKKVDNL